MTSVEDLSKTQIILLTLLISFITSIATGIITTSLLAQAPAGVTQTIDRVVERTVEQVAPTASSSRTTVREVTIVNVDDAVQSSIVAGSKSLVRIMTPPDGNGNKSFYALGVIISPNGLVLTDKRSLIANGSYTITLASGASYPASLVVTSDTTNLALLKIQADATTLAKGFPSVAVSPVEAKLGQTAVALEGQTTNAVAVGRVLTFNTESSRITTDITPLGETSGGMLLNLSGELLGLKTSNDDETLPASIYTSLAPIKALLAKNATIQ